MREFFRSTACRLVFVLCASAPFAPLPAAAFTPTGNEVADAFMAVLETDDGVVDSYGSVSEGGETVIIKNLLLKRKDDDTKSATIATTTLRDGMVQSNGRLKLGSLSMSDLSATSDDGGLAIGSFIATNLVLPTPEELNSNDGDTVVGPSYETLEVLDATISDGDGNKFDIGRLFTAIDEMDGDLPTAFRFAVDDLLLVDRRAQLGDGGEHLRGRARSRRAAPAVARLRSAPTVQPALSLATSSTRCNHNHHGARRHDRHDVTRPAGRLRRGL